MDTKFWHERRESNQTGFHQNAVKEHLARHWPALELAPGSRIVAPLCGKSPDLLWLREQGMAALSEHVYRLQRT
jgi:thiopurine S-methyltransferase